MPLYIHADFHRPEFHGLRSNGTPEWPPSPLRLAQALMAGWGALGQPDDLRPALDALVRLPAPVIHTPGMVTTSYPTLYAPHSGAVEKTSVTQMKKVFDLSHVGLARQNLVAKPTGKAVLDGTEVIFDLQDPERIVDPRALDQIARAVSYFGRSRDLCDLWVTTEIDEHQLPQMRWAPVTDRRANSRGWMELSTQWMDATYRAQTEGLDVPRPDPTFFQVPLGYVPEHLPAPSTEAPGAPGTAVRVFPVQRPVPARQIPGFMEPLTQTGLTCFPCVFSGNEHATGDLFGVGVVLNAEQAQDAALSSLVLDAQPKLATDLPETMTRYTTDPRRWSATSSTWVCATAIRAFPDERVITYQLQQWAEQVAGTTLVELQLSREPLEPWQKQWRQLPEGLDGWWVQMRLADPVTGPVMIGASPELGYGLMIPMEEHA